jgi:hypothetical protein
MPSSSIIGRSVGSLTTMTRALPRGRTARTVAQHQLRRNRPEQIVVDVEVRQIEERETIPLGQRRACAISAACSAAEISAVPVSA